MINGSFVVRSSSADRLALFFLFLGYVIFSIAFFLENVLGPYSSVFSVESYVLIARVIFIIIGLLCFFVFCRRSFPIARLLVLSFTIFYASLGTLGFVVNSPEEFSVFFAHLSVYVQFAVLVLGLSSIALHDDRFLISTIRRFAYLILVVNLFFLSALFVFVDVGLYISASLYSVGFSLSYFLSSRKVHPLGISQVLLVSLLSLKRGLFLATILHFLLVSKIGFKSFFIVFLAALMLFFGVYATYEIFPDSFFSKLIEANISRSIDSGSSLDAVSSGRVSIMTAVFNEISDFYGLIFGAGFGVVFNAYGFLDGRTAEWLTSGVDVIFAHFWLIHGVVFGTILYFIISFFIVYLFFTRFYKLDVIFAFFVNLLAFNYLVSLTSFTPWDPVWGLATGLLLARYRVLKRREHRYINVDSSLIQE
ncbi:hypothetical protein [Marinobacter alkaliphilus]|uniref:Uncharacterized protein n=1 Tax=Marinobacter alkaliphilus TaxID=254719 RepID=A0ABZ3DZC9_9GAMM